jgi:hypothetical protein
VAEAKMRFLPRDGITDLLRSVEFRKKDISARHGQHKCTPCKRTRDKAGLFAAAVSVGIMQQAFIMAAAAPISAEDLIDVKVISV